MVLWDRIKSHQNLDLPDSSWKSFKGARGSWLCKLINGELSPGTCFLSVLWLAFYLRAADVSGWTRVLQLILKPNNSMKLRGRTLCRWGRPGTAVKIFKNGDFWIYCWWSRFLKSFLSQNLMCMQACKGAVASGGSGLGAGYENSWGILFFIYSCILDEASLLGRARPRWHKQDS